MNPEKTNSAVGAIGRGNDPYGSSDFIKTTALDAADAGGVVGIPSIGGDYAMGGITKSASVAGPTGEVETTYNHENLSAKYKYPNVNQDIPAHGGPNEQYNDHS